MLDTVPTRTPPPHAPHHDRRRLVARIEAATPAHRDRALDALRAVAIFGVVLGHWLVTALVTRGDGELRVTSPLAVLPELVPISWVLQSLAIFFLVGGYTAAKGLRPGEPYGPWIRRRMARMARPVPALLLVWIPATAWLLWAGYSPGTLHALIKLVLSPLWFLGVYGALTALTPAVVAMCRRLGGYAVLIPFGVTALVDLGRFALGGPAWLGWVNLPAGWLVPYVLGVAWAGGTMFGRRTCLAMLAGGATATALLIAYAGYPASMVGVPGAALSNLNPPTLAAVTFGIAQAGLAMLLRVRLARLMRRPRLWAGVALANLSAMTIFLWHQTALMLITLSGLALGPLAGLHTVPDHLGWALDRLMWLPLFAAALGGCVLAFARFERPRRRAPRHEKPIAT